MVTSAQIYIFMTFAIYWQNPMMMTLLLIINLNFILLENDIRDRMRRLMPGGGAGGISFPVCSRTIDDNQHISTLIYKIFYLLGILMIYQILYLISDHYLNYYFCLILFLNLCMIYISRMIMFFSYILIQDIIFCIEQRHLDLQIQLTHHDVLTKLIRGISYNNINFYLLLKFMNQHITPINGEKTKPFFCIAHLEMETQSADESGECIICLEKYHKNDRIVRLRPDGLNCSHQFHTKCIWQWARVNDSCPVCRSIFK